MEKIEIAAQLYRKINHPSGKKVCDLVSVITLQKVIELEIIKTKVENEMETFITLTKYNTVAWRR